MCLFFFFCIIKSLKRRNERRAFSTVLPNDVENLVEIVDRSLPSLGSVPD